MGVWEVVGEARESVGGDGSEVVAVEGLGLELSAILVVVVALWGGLMPFVLMTVKFDAVTRGPLVDGVV